MDGCCRTMCFRSFWGVPRQNSIRAENGQNLWVRRPFRSELRWREGSADCKWTAAVERCVSGVFGVSLVKIPSGRKTGRICGLGGRSDRSFDGGRVRLTANGRLLSNDVFQEFLGCPSSKFHPGGKRAEFVG